jgi:hypothetical protein
VRARTMQSRPSMNTPELMLWSRDTTQRAAFVPHQPADHDPTAHRHAVDLDATVRVSGGELKARPSRVRAISLGGALLEFERLPVGALINLTFGLPSSDQRMSLDAIVQRCTPDGVNVLFDSLRAWEVWVLWRFLATLDHNDDADADLEPTKLLRVGGVPLEQP